ncbi:MAG: hypothetical protein OXG44_01495 [Gammaproteobacteria bacterium]|nr:hypothetical protein [Gammaproteobacteria bacterium]
MSTSHYTTVEIDPTSCPSQRYSAVMVHDGHVIERMSFRTLAEAERQADFSRFGIEYRPLVVPPAAGGAPRTDLEPDYEPEPVPIGVGYGGEIRWSDDHLPSPKRDPVDFSGIDLDDIPF